jgi:AAA+ ATPase superfamily predicted ATPase
MLPSIIFREQYLKLSRFTIVTGSHGVGKTDLLIKIENTKENFSNVHNITENRRSKLILESMQYLFPTIIKTEYDYPMHYDRSVQYLCDPINVLKRLLEKVHTVSIWYNVVPILHYTVLPRFFERVLHLANAFDIQVIFSTQSMDVIKAFQQAAKKASEQDIRLLRLDRINENTHVTTFDARDLSIATEGNIEVR